MVIKEKQLDNVGQINKKWHQMQEENQVEKNEKLSDHSVSNKSDH